MVFTRSSLTQSIFPPAGEGTADLCATILHGSPALFVRMGHFEFALPLSLFPSALFPVHVVAVVLGLALLAAQICV